MTASNATPAYRGYRLQALYVLSRILNLDQSENSNLVIQPEGIEDLAVFDDDNLIEVVQVKALTSDLSLSDFSLERPDSFFHRINSLLKRESKPKIVVVSFGPIGPELNQACKSDCKKRSDVLQKLERNGLSSKDAEIIINNLNLVPVEEAGLYEKIFELLRDILTGVDPNSAFELLTFWLYKCSEERQKIKRQDIINKINEVGYFLAERHAHHAEWFKSIIPIEDCTIEEKLREELDHQFHQGVSARYEHILADLDVRRFQKMEEIDKKFKSCRILVIHGASGQGKTTLAYRYVHDYFPSYWRFRVKLIENRKHALSIATALAGHVNSIGIPIVVYIDVSPNDNDWPELVKQLAEHPNINILVTIREEDWRRASIIDIEIPFSEVDLNLDRQEAELIYQALIKKNPSVEFLDFEDAWTKFGGKGPLMEFIYLITHGQSIKERLRQQINKLQDEVREKPEKSVEVELLKLVSIASAYQARLKVKSLADFLKLPVPIRTFQLLEKEYLLRLSEDRSLVGGLHPIRSTIIAELLTDPAFSAWSWLDSAIICLPIMHESDIGNFLLFTFSNKKEETKSILDFLASFQPTGWAAIAGVAKSLIWLGLIEYYEENKSLIREVFEKVGVGWKVVLDPDISDAIPGIESPIFHGLGGQITKEGRKQIELLKSRQTDKRHVFGRVSGWLSIRNDRPTLPQQEDDWEGLAETLFWTGRLSIHWPIEEWISNGDLEDAVETLPIDLLADISIGLFEGYKDKYLSWMRTDRIKLINRLRIERQILVLEDDGATLMAHFFINFENLNKIEINFNSEAMERIGIIRRLFPDREFYGCQGYGHKLLSYEQPFDETQKKIRRSILPVNWLTSINKSFIDYAEKPFRPNNWQDYSKLVFDLRIEVLKSLKSLKRILKIYFRSEKYIAIHNRLDLEKWQRCSFILSKPPSLPICALSDLELNDGFISDYLKDEKDKTKPYELYLDKFRTYESHLSNFFDQSMHALILNPILGRSVNNNIDKDKFITLAGQKGINKDFIRLSFFNLSDTVAVLDVFQKSFRNLLGQYINGDMLAKLENEETDIFNSLIDLWYSFVFNPGVKIKGSINKIYKSNDILGDLRTALQKELIGISSNAIKINIVSEEILWDQKPTLWLSANGKTGFDVYNNIANIYLAIQKAINKVGYNELKYFVLETHWRYIAVIPLIEGKCLTPTAWRVYSNVLSVANESNTLSWWNFAQHKIPQDAFIGLHLDIWTIKDIGAAFRLFQSIAELSVIAAHIKDLEKLRELDRENFNQIQEYIRHEVKLMEVRCQFALDSATEILAVINKIPSSELGKHPNAMEVFNALNELRNYIMPKDDCKSEITLSFDDLINWANKLEKGRTYAFMAYLFWVTEVLNNRRNEQ